MDLIEKPPGTAKYARIKARLLHLFTLSKAQGTNQLLKLQGLGDNTPSELMDVMLALLGDHNPCFLFKQIFMQQLPPEIRRHLIRANIEDCRELATAADQLYNPSGFSSNAIRTNVERKPKITASKPTWNGSD